MNGYLVYNETLKTDKFQKLHQRYLDSAKALNINLMLISNFELYQNINLKQLSELEIDFVLFLDKDIMLIKLLELVGIPCFNSSRVIELCDDKRKTYYELLTSGLPLIPTVFAPLAFKPADYTSFNQYLIKELGLPLVAKASCGSFGEQVYLIEDLNALEVFQNNNYQISHLYQKFMQNSKGRDVRVYVIGEEVKVSVLRVNKTDFRANVTNGGQMLKYDLSPEFDTISRQVAKYLKSDFIGIDLLFDDNDQPIICEVNSNAHIDNVYHVTNHDLSYDILNLIVGKLNA